MRRSTTRSASSASPASTQRRCRHWEAYELAVETGRGLVRVSVKTRSESAGWKTSRWFVFDDRKACDWVVLIFKPASGVLRSWVIPFPVARHSDREATGTRVRSGGSIKRRQTITLSLTYDDPTGNRQPPSRWDWQTLLAMAMHGHGHGPESVKVGAYGPAKPVELPEKFASKPSSSV